MVDKKDRGIRLCVDYNKISKFDAYPMPNVQEILDKVGPAKFISTLDLAHGYWQVPMAADSMEVTAFTTPYGLFEFTVMPFGPHNAPVTFQRMMNEVQRDCSAFSRSYIDDVVVFSHTWEELLLHLRAVLTCLQQANLSLKLRVSSPSRSALFGILVGEGRIEPDLEKIAAVNNFKQPTTKSEVRAFHGLASYYRYRILPLLPPHLQSY